MDTLTNLVVDLGERSYPIRIGHGLLGRPGLLDEYIPGKQAFIVTNEAVRDRYLDPLLSSLPSVAADCMCIGDGEAFKTLDTYATLMDRLIAGGHNRTTVIIALGGGVIGDVAGFVAATYQRGIAFIQVPTTLLALVDSSVGGKTAVNHPRGKNLIGAFHQPRCVIADIGTLETLPPRELKAGLAEVIKYGVIYDAAFFDWLSVNLERLLALDGEALVHAVAKSCRIKAAVVQADERETGLRAILNFGHTFGHALESLTGYEQLLHGEAVAIGMVMAADLSSRLRKLPREQARRIKDLIARAGLPVTPPPLSADAMLEAMSMDKKVVDGRIRLVLTDAIGMAALTDQAPEDAIRATLGAGDALCAE